MPAPSAADVSGVAPPRAGDDAGGHAAVMGHVRVRGQGTLYSTSSPQREVGGSLPPVHLGCTMLLVATWAIRFQTWIAHYATRAGSRKRCLHRERVIACIKSIAARDVPTYVADTANSSFLARDLCGSTSLANYCCAAQQSIYPTALVADTNFRIRHGTAPQLSVCLCVWHCHRPPRPPYSRVLLLGVS